MAYIRANGIKAPEGGLALPLPYTVCERPTYSVVPSNAFWRDPARADIAEILRKNEEDNRRRDLYFPLVTRDARHRRVLPGPLAQQPRMHGPARCLAGGVVSGPQLAIFSDFC